MELIPGMQDRFNIQKSNNVTYHINRTKNIYDHLNIYKESIWQNSIPTHNLKKKLTSMKNLQLTSYTVVKDWMLSFKYQEQDKHPFLFNIVREFQTNTIKEKLTLERKRWILFTDDTYVYMENPKTSTKNFPELMSLAESQDKINIWKSTISINSNEQLEIGILKYHLQQTLFHYRAMLPS